MNVQPQSARLRPFRPVPFGRYTLLSPLSMGGMGEIFLARLEGAQGFEKLCVIKKILPQLAQDPEFVERFLNEARILVKLSHGSIAQVLDVGLHEGDPYIALEFVDGKDLRKIAARARDRTLPLPLTLVLYVMGRVLDALAYAHRKRDDEDQDLGLVHRDVSPQNILISYEGEVKVIDFGLAKSTLSSARTNPSMILGKFLYMSPEQARHQRVDRRSDLYSAGLCLYELVCGRNPFDDVSPQELMVKVANPEIPPIHTVDPLCPAAVQQMVTRALELDPDRRFQTAEEFRAGLQACLMEIDTSAGPESVTRYMREAFSAEYQQERRLLSSLRTAARPSEDAPEPAPVPADKSREHETAVSDLRSVAPSPEAARALAEAPSLPRVAVEGPILPAPLSFAPTPRTREDSGGSTDDGETVPGVIVTEELRLATALVPARPQEETSGEDAHARAVAAEDTHPRVILGTLLEEPPMLPGPLGRVRTPTRPATPIPGVEVVRTGPVTRLEPVGPRRSRALLWVAVVLVGGTLAAGGWFFWDLMGRPGARSLPGLSSEQAVAPPGTDVPLPARLPLLEDAGGPADGSVPGSGAEEAAAPIPVPAPADQSELIEALTPGTPAPGQAAVVPAAQKDARPKRASAELRQLKAEWALLRRTYRVLERRRTCESRQMKMLCSRYSFLEGELDGIEDEPGRIRQLRTEVRRLNDDLRAVARKGR